MPFILASVGIFVFGGVLSFLLGGRRRRISAGVGIAAAIVGAAAALVPAIIVLGGGEVGAIHWPWSMPMGSITFSLAMDGLSALFLFPIVCLPAVAAVYGGAYLRSFPSGSALRSSWFFFNLLTASMVMLVSARNGVLFLLAWEVMSLASFFLVTMENQEESVRRAGWTYLVATHLGTAFLLVMFFLLAGRGGSMDFDQFAGGDAAGVIFLLAMIGFGTKAGFIPMHVWLPEAHPAAPSHVSAVMSGVMIKTGIYGLARTLTFLGPPAEWWGWVLVGVGVTSGVMGVLLALAQHDLKRLLAYHSVENIGIIAIGLGLGTVGLARGNAAMAVLGFAGGLLHVVNHATFKGLLFLGAGAVAQATGTREIDRLGGLIKKMPVTAGTFLVGSAAISALPPLNGFISEFLIYLGSYRAAAAPAAPSVAPALVAIGGLALIGGLAAACFAKAFGVVFLGEPRSEQAKEAREAAPAMRAAMIVLAGCCVAIGLLSPVLIARLGPAVASATGLTLEAVAPQLATAGGTLAYVTAGACVFLGLLLGLILLRRRLLAGRAVGEAGTWDCGYAAPTARMQYTASSFTQPLVDMFRAFLRTHRKYRPPQGLFPAEASLETHTPDVFAEGLFRRAFLGVQWAAGRLRWLQHGRLQLYVLYVVLTLLVLLAWKLG
jgi:formate hydrogenlyase subunit 3/multisubunit Na+/H+ antiporter MnhD subunit